ncbi:hypothetical protein PR048_025442 [Dryococelus australis]|uniref:Uncharacterized protein n=1 Tax=Dryococelus australis TaxID=614101 RepID=A0ABQ9GRA5_9NEOP|nr:hypothetical protein PR048_025442 [Dryococelus australis]
MLAVVAEERLYLNDAGKASPPCVVPGQAEAIVQACILDGDGRGGSICRMEQRQNARAGEMGNPRENTLASTVPTCENSGVIPPGIEPDSPWGEASSLTTTPPRPLFTH